MRTNWGCDFFVVFLPQQCWDAQAPALLLPEPARSPHHPAGPAWGCDISPERNFINLPSLVSVKNSISCGDFLLIVCRDNRGRQWRAGARPCPAGPCFMWGPRMRPCHRLWPVCVRHLMSLWVSSKFRITQLQRCLVSFSTHIF